MTEISVEEYHEVLMENLGRSKSLHSINRSTPREWIEKSFDAYKKFLIASIRSGKEIHRMTVIDKFEKYNDIGYYDEELEKCKKAFDEMGRKTVEFIDNFLKIDVADKLNGNFTCIVNELNQSNYDLLRLFLQIHNPQDEALFVYKNFEMKFAALLGNSHSEILIYDKAALKVECNEANNTYTIVQEIKDDDEVSRLRSVWLEIHQSAISHATKAIRIKDALKRLFASGTVRDNYDRFNEEYKCFFIGDNNEEMIDKLPYDNTPA